MGIPGLTARLRPYAQPVEWRKKLSQDSTNNNDLIDHIIIDGPSLAYHIYHSHLKTHHSDHPEIKTLPSYAELASYAENWLHTLESFGFKIRAIFFDGYLPPAKTSVRLERLQRSFMELKRFKADHPHFSIYGLEKSAPPASRSNKEKRDTNRLAPIPAPSFLVPIVLDRLLSSSKYADRTKLVPSEADTACAEELAKYPDDFVLTSDSDLLLLCARGKVLMLGDLTDVWSSDASVLKGLVYQTAQIINNQRRKNPARLRVRDVVYHMAVDTHASLLESIQYVRRKSSERLSKQADAWFAAEMCAVPVFVSDRLRELYGSCPKIFATLHPRVSEMICSWFLATSFPQTNGVNGRNAVKMCLPFLIDDPGRASAWRVRESIRRLDYSVLFHGSSLTDVKMLEVDRRGERYVESELPLYNQSEVQAVCKELVDSFGRMCRIFDSDPLDPSESEEKAVRAWQLVGIFLALESMRESASSLPEFEDVYESIFSMTIIRSWSTIHFRAQVDGLLYSCLMLKSVLEIILEPAVSSFLEQHGVQSKSSGFEELLSILRSIPPVEKLVPALNVGYRLGNECSENEKSNIREALAGFYGDIDSKMLDKPNDVVEDGCTGTKPQKVGKRNRKKRRRHSSENEAMSVSVIDPNNIYSVLG